MKKTNIYYISIGILAFAFGLSGCASSRVPENSITEAQIYHEAMQESNKDSLNNIREDLSDQIKPGNLDVPDKQSDDSRAIMASDELDSQFPRLENPETIVYVYPHFGPDGVPVPGYYTKFYLYQHDHYALPGDGE